MDSSNLPKPDYYEFAKVMSSLAVPIPDEKTRMIAAFASIQAQTKEPFTKEILINAAQHYIGIIQQDKQKFEDALVAKQQSEIGNRKEKIDEVSKQISANKQQIDSLNKEIVSLTTSIQAIQAEVTEVEARIKTNKTGYTVACNSLITKLNSDVEKIKINL